MSVPLETNGNDLNECFKVIEDVQMVLRYVIDEAALDDGVLLPHSVRIRRQAAGYQAHVRPLGGMAEN